MTLDELKVRLRLPLDDTSQDAYLIVDLDDAIACVKRITKQSFKDGIPDDVKRGIALIVKAMQENPSVRSQSLGDMSKTFEPGGTLEAAYSYIKPYRSVY